MRIDIINTARTIKFYGAYLEKINLEKRLSFLIL